MACGPAFLLLHFLWLAKKMKEDRGGLEQGKILDRLGYHTRGATLVGFTARGQTGSPYYQSKNLLKTFYSINPAKKCKNTIDPLTEPDSCPSKSPLTDILMTAHFRKSAKKELYFERPGKTATFRLTKVFCPHRFICVQQNTLSQGENRRGGDVPQRYDSTRFLPTLIQKSL
jgi:hypothetical protein